MLGYTSCLLLLHGLVETNRDGSAHTGPDDEEAIKGLSRDSSDSTASRAEPVSSRGHLRYHIDLRTRQPHRDGALTCVIV